mgnify:CR=1 FL=1
MRGLTFLPKRMYRAAKKLPWSARKFPHSADHPSAKSPQLMTTAPGSASSSPFFSDGENVAAGRGYALETPPTPVRARESYPDDGRKLTDGQVTAFAPRMVVGWRDNEERTVTVDLHGLCALDEVLAWTMTGAPMGIVPLPSARVEISEDGEVWRELGEALVEDAPATPSTPCACRVDAAGVQARYVRVTVQREEGWAMLSEIEVRGERVE